MEPFGNKTCIAGPFDRSTGEVAARFEAGTAALFCVGDVEEAQAVEGIDSTSLTFPAPHDHRFAPSAVLTSPEKSLGMVQDGRAEDEEGFGLGIVEDEAEDSDETAEAVTVAVSSSMMVDVKRIVEVTVMGAAV